jgi:hypothetical protein
MVSKFFSTFFGTLIVSSLPAVFSLYLTMIGVQRFA